jgi:hypothetical protein
MADLQRPVMDLIKLHDATARDGIRSPLHPAWLRLMQYCADLGYGEIEKLKIQDGLPMVAEVTTKKIKFST